jgi:selenocysteine lyase/cysteine desulfurase
VVSEDDLYDRFAAAVTDKTKLILVCHITNRTGVIFPIRRICDMAREKGIPVIVDGAHAFNHFPFKISDLNCDYYGVSLHKWTFAPIGTGFLYVRKSRIKQTWPLMAAAERADDDIRKFEEIGTHPAANHNAICEAVTFNQNIGIDRKAARLRYLRDRWANRVAKIPGVKILHSQGELSCGIGMFTFEDAEKLRELGPTLTSKHNIYTATSSHRDYVGMRVTPSVYSTPAEVDYFAGAVEEELRRG